MNGIDLFGSPLAQAAGWAIVHLLWQGALIAAILAAVLTLMERQSAGARYLVSCSALVLLLGAGIVTARRAYVMPQSFAPVSGQETIAQAGAEGLPQWSVVATTIRSALPAVVLLWLAGVVLLSGRLLWSWLAARRIVHDGIDAGAHLQHIAHRLARTLGFRRMVRLVESSAVDVPAVFGFFRPVILIPVQALTGLSMEQVEMILAHELAHVRRHDFLVNLLQAVVETLLFYHPAVWWMSRQVRIERENCCDDMAVAVCGNALDYARALARLEELRGGELQAVVAADGGSLIARIRRIVDSSPGHPRSRATSSLAGAAVLALLTILVAMPSMPLHAASEAVAVAPAKTPSAVPAVAEIDVSAMDVEATDVDAEETSDAGDADVVVNVAEVPEVPAVDVEMETPVEAEADIAGEPVIELEEPMTNMEMESDPVAPLAPFPAMPGFPTNEIEGQPPMPAFPMNEFPGKPFEVAGLFSQPFPAVPGTPAMPPMAPWPCAAPAPAVSPVVPVRPLIAPTPRVAPTPFAAPVPLVAPRPMVAPAPLGAPAPTVAPVAPVAPAVRVRHPKARVRPTPGWAPKPE